MIINNIVIKILRLIKVTFYIICGWLLIFPVSFLFPKKKNLISFIGKYSGKFDDNIKYLYLHIHNEISDKEKNPIEYFFITGRKDVYDELKAKNFPVLFYPSYTSIIKLLRTRVVIVDCFTWGWGFKYYLLSRCYLIQLWHGANLKRIQYDNFKHMKKKMYQEVIKTPNSMKKMFAFLIAITKLTKANFENYSSGTFPKYDLVLSTSKFYTDEVFTKAFRHKEIITAGYPRNDVFFQESNPYILVGTDEESINKIIKFKSDGHKMILFAPTFRDNGGDPLSDKALDIYKLSDYARENRLIFVFKFHPNPIYWNMISAFPNNIILYNAEKDIYPALKYFDTLVTDYSSIYMDFLYLDKPVIFFCYDYEKYINQDRELQFDYNWITPGPKCYNQDELEAEINKILDGNIDLFKDKREDIFKMAFDDNMGDASKRIWNYVKENMLKSD
jgi:CDP-glycerol glycerophosphotransferase